MKAGAMPRRIAGLLIAVMSLTACGESWLGDRSSPPLPGKRISILSRERLVEPDPAGAAEIILPPPEINEDWPQVGGYSNHAMHHLEIGDAPQYLWYGNAGVGSGARSKLLGQPIIADNTVFTIDSRSNVTAFVADKGKRLWRTDLTPDGAASSHTSGGLAYEDGMVFAATGFAQVVGMNAQTGEIVWRQTLPAPMRGAPTVRGGRVLVVTVENQTHALAAEDGAPLWTHTGTPEPTGLLAGNSPAVDGNTVVVAYTSGELFALKIESGAPIWQDSLITARRTENIGSLMDIRGLPAIDRGRVYVIGNGDLMVCLDLKTGRRLWEKEIGGIQGPWVAGDFLYQLTNGNEVVALDAKTGRIIWVTQMQSWEDPEDKEGRITWAGPILASDRLILTSSEGKMVTLSPYTGDMLGWEPSTQGISIAPSVANGMLYFLTDLADLVVYR
ncbi:PQQ-binding-like beta-propeller repeat protein [Magnetospirillum sp. SS-4]|uniref:PQQ-binding-like beta-propeller repeat protein n=1 Tax=Magnetospirillum sp. SS-4 TaxID=2681465 RepID=UPI00137EA099|nr:PQQ-binding-like beta-propeller repeat protein [Magnetospirillum sp. SS-4]CAA7615505.1 WD40-like repeat [Magnetospirillum sp. SS-4]